MSLVTCPHARREPASWSHWPDAPGPRPRIVAGYRVRGLAQPAWHRRGPIATAWGRYWVSRWVCLDCGIRVEIVTPEPHET